MFAIGERPHRISTSEQALLRRLTNDAERLNTEASGLQGDVNLVTETASDDNLNCSGLRQRQEQARSLVDSSLHALDELGQRLTEQTGRLDTTYLRVLRETELANTFKQLFYNELQNHVAQRCLEALSDLQNQFGDIMLMAFHAMMALRKAFVSGEEASPLNSGLGTNRLLQVRKPSPDRSPEQYTTANSSYRGYLAESGELARSRHDPFYDNRVTEARRDFNQATASLATANSELEHSRERRDGLTSELQQRRNSLLEISTSIRNIREGNPTNIA